MIPINFYTVSIMTILHISEHGRAAPGRRRTFLAVIFALVLAAVGSMLPRISSATEESEFIEPDRAFPARVEAVPQGIAITFDVVPGYHLYKERFAIDAEGPPLAPAVLPEGKTKFDANFNKTMTLWAGSIRIEQALPPGKPPGLLTVRYQGCADRGLCYPPQQALVHLQRDSAGQVQARWEAQPDALAPVVEQAIAGSQASQPASSAAPLDQSAAALQSGSLVRVIGMFLLGGLLLSFTPCVLPMLPILSSIIVGQGTPVSRARGFTLALAYAMGMALVYTGAGVIAGLLGSGFAAALQNPWVLGSFALLLSALALSMFGVWEFQMPGFIQNRINNASNQIKGGRHLGVFFMGGLSALLVGPCVAAPLAGALVYISQTRDVVLGGSALFALACGMSVPLLLLGLSAGELLPRAGRWMEHVKTFFGLVLLAVALWLVSPVLPIAVLIFLIGATALTAAICLGSFEAGRPRALRAAGTLVALWSVAMMGGALSGGDSVMQPLRHLAGGARPPAAAQSGGQPAFERITTVAQLDEALAATGRPVMLDFYADWCVSCKEMEHLTFSKPSIAARMSGARLLQADVTANSAEAKALLKRFQLFGPPAILFFDTEGRELAAARTIGFLPADKFATQLDRAGL